MVALVHLMPILAFHRPLTDQAEKPANARVCAGLLAPGLMMVLLFLLAFPTAVLDMYYMRLDRLHGKSCQVFINVLPQQAATTQSLGQTYAQLIPAANALDQLGVLDYSLLKTRRLSDFKLYQRPDGQPCGFIEYCKPSGTNFLIAGWAVSPTHKTAADCVLFTYEGPGVEPTIFGLMDQRLVRRDLVLKLGGKSYLLAGWRKTGSLHDLPKGQLKVKAWAFDVNSRQVALLVNDVDIDNK
jgi:hypothetical protein